MAHAGGRPPSITLAVLNKLEEVFALGGTDVEACFFAGISHQTLYSYQEKHPQFLERKRALKEQPVLKARRTINKAIEEDPTTAKWYVERRDRDFNPKQEVDITSKGESIVNPEIMQLADEAARLLKEKKL